MLFENKQIVDALNVFPVPDGDTGTNMSLTALAAAVEIEKINSPNIYDVAKAASNGSLRGARGNSGVILSQLFRGFSKGLEGKEVATADDIAFAFVKAMETAYKAVMKPKEGTILTIAKAIGDKAVEMTYETEDIDIMIKEVIKYSNEILQKTTDMLPQLKQADVVDAGGRGLLYLIEGGIQGKNKDDIKIINTDNYSPFKSSPILNTKDVDIKYGYCTEFFIHTKKIDEKTQQNLKEYLTSIGDSIVMVSDDDIIKIHVHTDNPGKALERALKIGSLENIKIENMRIQHTNRISFSEMTKEEEPSIQQKEKDTGFVVISAGSGLNNIFLRLGADIVVEGGQTMNPSTEDIIEAVDKVEAKNVIILPNNKNIILAAQQAAEFCKNKNVSVILTKTIPQGISAMVNFIPSGSIEENILNMNEGMKTVVTGQITHSIRDTLIDNKKIKKGDYLCIIEDKIEMVSKNLQHGIKQLIKIMIDKNPEGAFLSIYYGKDVSEEQVRELIEFLDKNYVEYELEVHSGNQPVYYYIVSIE